MAQPISVEIFQEDLTENAHDSRTILGTDCPGTPRRRCDGVFTGGVAACAAGRLIRNEDGAELIMTLQTLNGHASVVVTKLREIAPYAAMELILPGGSLMALMLWLYRRRKGLA